MAASNAKLGAGSALYMNTTIIAVPGTNLVSDWVAAGGAWTLVFAEPTSIGLPGAEASDIDVTHLLSPNRRREFIPGPIDSGTITGTARWLPAEYVAVMANVGTKMGIKIVTVSSGTADQASPAIDSTIYFLGHISIGNGELTFDGVREYPFTVKIDSDPAISAV